MYWSWLLGFVLRLYYIEILELMKDARLDDDSGS